MAATPKDMPVIFVNHFPLNRDLSNWYEVVDILKTRDIRAVLAGHLHVKMVVVGTCRHAYQCGSSNEHSFYAIQ